MRKRQVSIITIIMLYCLPVKLLTNLIKSYSHSYFREFYYVNDYFGDVRSPSVKESDLTMAHDLVSRAYGSRILS